MNFWVISNFGDFLFCFKFLLLLLGLPWQYIGPHDEMSMIIPLLKSNSSFCCLATCQEWPKWTGSLQNWGKNHKKTENQPKFILHFSESILSCTIVFRTSKKFPNIDDYVVKRIFRNNHIWPRNMQSKW